MSSSNSDQNKSDLIMKLRQDQHFREVISGGDSNETCLIMNVTSTEHVDQYSPSNQHVHSLPSPLVVLAFPVSPDVVSAIASGIDRSRDMVLTVCKVRDEPWRYSQTWKWNAALTCSPAGPVAPLKPLSPSSPLGPYMPCCPRGPGSPSTP